MHVHRCPEKLYIVVVVVAIVVFAVTYLHIVVFRIHITIPEAAEI